MLLNNYVTISIILVIVANLIYIFEKKVVCSQRIYLEFFIIASLSLWYAFRPNTVPDTQVYIDAYQRSIDVVRENTFQILNKYQDLEYGFWVLCAIFRSIFSDYRVMLFVISAITIGTTPASLAKIFFDDDYKKHVSLVRCMFITGFSLLYAGIAIRAGLAMALGTEAIYRMKVKKYFSMSVLFFAAVSIQRSSILLLLIGLLLVVLGKKPGTREVKKTVLCIVVCESVLFAAGLRFSANINIIINSILLRTGLVGYGAYLISDGGVALGLTKLLLCSILIITLFLVLIHNIDSNLFEVWIFFFIITLVMLTVGIKAASRIYDMALIFVLPILSRFVQKENRTIGLCFGYVLSQVGFAIIAINGCFPQYLGL